MSHYHYVTLRSEPIPFFVILTKEDLFVQHPRSQCDNEHRYWVYMMSSFTGDSTSA